MTALDPTLEAASPESVQPKRRRGASSLVVPALSGGSMAYSQLLTAGFGVFLAAFLGAEAFGAMNLARNILINAVFLTPLGLDQALQRHFGERGADHDAAADLFWLRLVPFVLSGAMVVALVAGGAALIQQHLFRHSGFATVLVITLAALPFNTDMMVLGGAYRGRYRPLPSIVSTFLIQPTLRVVAILGLSLMLDRLSAAVVGTLVSFVLAWLFIAIQSRRDFPVKVAALRPALPAAAAVLRYAPILGTSTFLFAMAKTLDVSALGLLDDLADVGRYSVVVMACQLVGTVGNALGQTIGASVASAAKAGDKGLVARMLYDNMELSALLSAPLCVAVAVWGADSDLLLGGNYATPWTVFAIVAVSQWVFTVCHNCSSALSMTGRHNTELANNMLALAIEVAACVLLIPHFGMTGAALATGTMVLCLNAVRQIQIGAFLGDALIRWRLFAPLLVSAALALPFVWIGHMVGFRAWWLTALLAGSHVAASITVMVAVLTTPTQRRRLLEPFGRLIGRARA